MPRSIATIEADIALIDEEMRPLREMRRDLAKELEAARDALAASDEVGDLELAALSANSREAGDKLSRIMGEMHPAMRMLTHWMPDPYDYSTGYYAAPNLILDYNADEKYAQALAKALVAFAQRFVPTERPDGAQEGHLAFADILDHGCGQFASWAIWFEPVEGGGAKFVNRRGHSAREDQPLRPLVDVIREACKTAWYEGGPRRNSDEYDEYDH